MLVLARKSAETIVIDGRITVTILQQRGGTVLVGIEAPGEVPVFRGEVQEQVNRDGQKRLNANPVEASQEAKNRKVPLAKQLARIAGRK